MFIIDDSCTVEWETASPSFGFVLGFWRDRMVIPGVSHGCMCVICRTRIIYIQGEISAWIRKDTFDQTLEMYMDKDLIRVPSLSFLRFPAFGMWLSLTMPRSNLFSVNRFVIYLKRCPTSFLLGIQINISSQWNVRSILRERKFS